MTYRVDISADARAAIRKYVRYVAVERQAPLSAERWLQRVLGAVESLEQFPRRCPLAPENEFRPYEIRMRVVGDYVLLYTVDDTTATVHIIGFRHGHKQPRPDELPEHPPE